ncbi:MAG: hypothetical protein J2O49_03660 [Sciscionella sp.]|nr:hypothetical protein [Sciscionella sp.]
MMRRLRAFGAFCYDFVVGDDWRIAVAVVFALAVTMGVAGTGVAAWWVLPVVVFAVLPWSLWRASLKTNRRS